MRLLQAELNHLRAEHVILQLAIGQHDLRLDGKPRANARPAHEGVILTFEHPEYGPLTYPADRYDDWQDNVRAIALSLKSLRDVDRYGVTRRGEQYTGWGQLPPAGGSTVVAKMSARIAAEVLVDAEQMDGDPDDLLIDAQAVRFTYQNAAKKVHPDVHGGDTRRFQLVSEAKSVLDEHHRVTR
jgi:hypothetical protein